MFLIYNFIIIIIIINSYRMKIDVWLIKNKIKPSTFAKTIGYGKGNLSLLLRGKIKPSLKTSLKIQQATNNEVQPIDFYKEESK